MITPKPAMDQVLGEVDELPSDNATAPQPTAPLVENTQLPPSDSAINRILDLTGQFADLVSPNMATLESVVTAMNAIGLDASFYDYNAAAGKEPFVLLTLVGDDQAAITSQVDALICFPKGPLVLPVPKAMLSLALQKSTKVSLSTPSLMHRYAVNPVFYSSISNSA